MADSLGGHVWRDILRFRHGDHVHTPDGEDGIVVPNNAAATAVQIGDKVKYFDRKDLRHCIQRRVHVSNAYASGDEEEHDDTVWLAPREAFDTDDEYDEYADEVLFALTGTGRTTGNAYYEVESIDGLEPTIHKEWG